MKITSIVVAIVASAPFLLQASQNVAVQDPWGFGKDITFAGLVWYLVGFMFPKILKEHRAEREKQATEFNSQLEAERLHREEKQKKHYESLDSIGQECHAVQREANVMLEKTSNALDNLADRLDSTSD